MDEPPQAISPNSSYDDEPREPEDEPSRVFFMEDKIEGFKRILESSGKCGPINELSPPLNLLLHSFQHWVYNHTGGQLLITNLKGSDGIVSKPIIYNLNPK